ncbi:MAG: hypothetical protein LPK26_08975 [Bacillaceae bacterium]|nr:hypothetical protein [Bacillaceae bacterium]
MNILTYALIGVLVLLMLSCFKGMRKQGGGSCCSMIYGGKDSCKTTKHNKDLSSQTSSPKTPIKIQKMYVEMEKMEKQNQHLLKEIESLKVREVKNMSK